MNTGSSAAPDRTARVFASYQEALTTCFVEEAQGIAYFATLAQRETGAIRTALDLMAQIEAVMVASLTPLMQRHGFGHPPLAALADQGHAEALAEAPWPDLLRDMAENFDGFVAELQQTHDLAPPDDRPLMHRLILHEKAIIDYARAQRAGHPEPLAPLQAFLAGAA